MKNLFSIMTFVSLLVIFSGCAGQQMVPLQYIDEFGNINEVSQSLQRVNDSRNWKSFEVSMEAVFCATKKPGCTEGRVYQVSKYLPKKFLGYRYIIFKNDAGEENLYMLDNLPRNSDRLNIEKVLEKIDP